MSATARTLKKRHLTPDEVRGIRALTEFIATELPPIPDLHISTIRRSRAPVQGAEELSVTIDLRVSARGNSTKSAGELTPSGGTDFLLQREAAQETAAEHIRNTLQILSGILGDIPDRTPAGAFYTVRALDIDALKYRLRMALELTELGQ